MAQDEVPITNGMLDNSVHIYFDHPPGLIFGGLIPKGRYANISLLGRKLPPTAMKDFLEGTNLISLFPTGARLCGCAPQVAVSPAARYYADRLAVVGDAAVTRLYKDGIGAAFITAEAAARTAIQRGVSRQDFARGYGPTCRRIAYDNLFGRLLFRLGDLVRQSPVLLDSWQQTILREAALPPGEQNHTRALWSMFTGDETYRKIFQLQFNPQVLAGFAARGSQNMDQPSKTGGLGPLAEGGKVVIIGGGPGGAATAIALIDQARALGRSVTVTVVEGKQFSGEQHHNQCVGVLSPPIAELLERDLGLPFPHQLGRSDITGYVLHSNGREIVLDGEDDPSVALRRVQFDAYMLAAAGERGAEVHPARATGLEFHDDRVVVYTENAPLTADVVVGAFGLDEGTGVLFRTRSATARPRRSAPS